MMGKKMDSFDVVICGAGPAGCSAAITLVNQGASVLLFDKSDFPREKPCGGLLTGKTYQILTGTLGIKTIDRVIQHRANGFEIFSAGQRINSAETDDFTYFAHRRDLDNLLFDHARNSGCSILTEASMEDHGVHKIKVKGKWYKYGYLLGADGVFSTVRKLIMPPHSKNMAFGMQVDIPLSAWREDTDWKIPKIFFGYVKYGWGWVFPKGSQLSVGLAGLFERPARVKDSFRRFLSDLSCLEHSRAHQVRGAWIPYGSYTKNPCKGNILLLGDAAGFVDPITGEGIYFALRSGHCAAISVIENNNVPMQYKRRCQDIIIRPLREALFARRFLFEEPFHSYAMKKMKTNRTYMDVFMKVLSGTTDYKGYFSEIIRRKLWPR